LFLALLLGKVGQVCSNPIATVQEQVHQRFHLASAAWIPCYTQGTEGSEEMNARCGIDGKRRGPAGSRGDVRDLDLPYHCLMVWASRRNLRACFALVT
ncbi:hypothetical protein EV122DRAFT_271477, partial [Schizophyllum commune]